jgi:anaerobic magnesium-protoporphyrin IX monomethyl ester cyclase
MKDAGCYRITFGIESGSPVVRKFIRKEKSLSQAKGIIQEANRLGMWTNTTNILGFPNETKEDIEETFRFSKESGVDFAGFYLLSPIPSSDVAVFFNQHSHQTMAEEGLDTNTLTGKELKEIQKGLYRRFTLHKVFKLYTFFGKIRSWEDFKFVLRMLKVGLGILIGTFTMKNTLTLLYKHKR